MPQAPILPISAYQYVLCFLTRGEQVLLLHRRKEPNFGRWNGVGGHLEPGESPAAACLREVREESGFSLRAGALRFGGLVSWYGWYEPGGMYLFQAEAPEGDPVSSAEGPLAWHTLEWILSSGAVVSNIPIFLPPLLARQPRQDFCLNYRADGVFEAACRPLPGWLDENFLFNGTFFQI
ncbi:MAG: 8-oxo-dGTP diphosphatase [Anaerolineaceae bacterium]|nr:8-oxo-dGTP diphosphatase [Anaerolineaceae bacterium]